MKAPLVETDRHGRSIMMRPSFDPYSLILMANVAKYLEVLYGLVANLADNPN